MKALLLVAGLALVGFGGYILARGLTYTKKDKVVDLGILKAEMQHEEPVPPWIGGVVAVAGAGLVLAGARRKA